MKNRKEYNDRWNAPLVNPGFTLEEYELERIRRRLQAEIEAKPTANPELERNYEIL